MREDSPPKTFRSELCKMESRRHLRAQIKLPVIMMTPYGLMEGETKNLGLGGAFVHFREGPSSNNGLPVVSPGKWYSLWLRLHDEGQGPRRESRLVSFTAQVVWANTINPDRQTKSREIGVYFTRPFVRDPHLIIKAISPRICH